MISSTPRHCWKSAGWAQQRRVTRPPVCCARRAAKRTATRASGVLSTTTRNLRGRSREGSLMGEDADTMGGAAARVRPMTIGSEEQLEKLRHAGRVVAATMHAMAAAMAPGMTTRELDALGRAMLAREGARPAPESTYKFPGATCI